METFWFALLAATLTVYVVLDGFDLGAGALHLLVGRTDGERRQVLKSIGPVWDGNEVWLIASGALLVLGFPVVYATAFSGFYLPLVLTLWLLIGRGVAIELRGHLDSPLWRPFWDVVFSLSSAALVVVLGAALANVVRGVPLDEEGRFFAPLWTDFALPVPGAGHEQVGVLDPYTLLGGVTALAVLALHGACWLLARTSGPVHDRARRWAGRTWWAAAAGAVALSAATFLVQPHVAGRMAAPGVGWAFPALALAGLVGVRRAVARRLDGAAFLSSCAFVAGLLLSAAWGLFPFLLPATTDPARGLSTPGAASDPDGLRTALWWLVPGLALATTWFVLVYRAFAGRVPADDAAPAPGDGA